MIKLINILFYLGIILCFFTTGCLKHVPVLITSDPSGAQIYRGSKNQKKLYMASGTTPHTYNVSKKPPLYLDEWYTKFMVKKEGYEDSEIQKADGNIDRLHFVLKPLHSANLKDIEQAKNILKAEAYKNNNADIPDFDSQINKLCSQISEEMSGNNKTTVAVFEFSDLDGNVSELGKYISEEIITKLFQAKKFKVIERQLLNKIIAEQKSQVTGLFDETTVKKLGKLLGVNTIISGTLTELKNSVKINARLIGTESAEIFATASCEIEKDASIQELLGRSTKNDQPLESNKRRKN